MRQFIGKMKLPLCQPLSVSGRLAAGNVGAGKITGIGAREPAENADSLAGNIAPLCCFGSGFIANAAVVPFEDALGVGEASRCIYGDDCSAQLQIAYERARIGLSNAHSGESALEG